MTPTDSELLRRFVEQGDQPAFAEIVRRHLHFVYNAALRRVNGNTHLAEEAAQIAFTQLAQKAWSLCRHPALAGWLHTSTRYAASALLRREARRSARESSAAAMHSTPHRDDPPPWEHLRPVIDDALDHLGTKDREALVLRFFSGRSYAEIGTSLALSEEAARKRVDRALNALRQRFATRGITTTAAALGIALTQAPVVAAPATLGAQIAAGAVSAGATGGVTASALLGFMGTTKLAVIGAASLAVVGLGTFGAAMIHWELQQRAESRQLATLSAELDAFDSRARASIAKNAVAAEAQPTAYQPLPTAATAAIDPAAEQLALMKYRLQHPAFASFRQEETRLRVQREFGAFLAAKGYSPDEARTVREAIAACYDGEEADQFSLLSRPPGSLPSPLPNRREEMFAALRPILGENRTTELQRCVMAQEFLPAAQQVGLDLADAGEPISATQQIALAMVIADGNSPLADRASRARRDQLDAVSGLTAGERAQLDDATAFLSARQLAAFEAYLRERRLRAALTNRAFDQANAPQS